MLFLFVSAKSSLAQNMGINASGARPDSSAMLDVSDTTRGFLMPRMTTIQMDNIANPAEGLIIYNTTDSAYYYFNGNNWSNAAFASRSIVPVGTILSYGGDTSAIPNGYLLCNGLSLDTGLYAPLFTAIGYAWGGAGASFSIPDLRGRFLRGTDLGAGRDPDAAGRTGGDNVGSTQDDEYESHQHGGVSSGTVLAGLGASTARGTTASNTALAGGNETRPKNANVNFIICFDSEIAQAGGTTSAGSLTQTLSFTSPNLSISGGNTVDLSSLISSSGTPDLDSVLAAGNDAQGDSIVNLGSLSVGTATPLSDMTVHSPAGWPELSLSSGITGGAIFSYVTFHSSVYSGVTNRSEAIWQMGFKQEGASTNAADRWYVGRAGVSSQDLLVDRQGWVGVGELFPTERLDVAGNARVDSLVIHDGSNSPSAGDVLTAVDATGKAYWATPGAGDTLSVIQDNDGNTKIQTEESANEDKIRFDVAGNENYVMDGRRLHVLNTGSSVYIGLNAGNNDNAGSNANVAVGERALETNSSTGTQNVAVGYYALRNNASGYQNIAVGYQAMNSSGSSGNSNVAIGHTSSLQNTNPIGNVTIGHSTGFHNTTGDYNTYVGYQAGFGVASTAQSGNVFLGRQAGYSETGSNKLYIENSISPTPLIYGDFANDSLKIYGSLSIGDSFTLPINRGQSGQVMTSDGVGGVSWTATSGDNLGDHTATQNIQLNGNFLSNDGGNEGLSIANNGQVTATPATTGAGNFAFFTNGDMRTTGSGTGIYLTNTNIGITGNNGNSGDMRIKTGSTDRIRILGGGQVGINTTNPAYQLDVAGTFSANSINVNDNYTLPTTDGASGDVLTTDGSGTVTWNSTSSFIQGLEDVLLVDSSANNHEIRNVRELSIGVNSGAGLLHVTGDTLNDIVLRTTNNANSQGIAFQNSGNAYTWNIFREDAGSNNANLVFSGGVANANLISLSERMRLTSSGRVGIGTSSPSSVLEVSGGMRADSIVAHGVYHKGYESINYMRFLGNNDVQIRSSSFASIGASDNIHLNVPSSTTMLSVTDSGVGIGETSPDAMMHVQGDLLLDRNGSNNVTRTLTIQGAGPLGSNVFGRIDFNGYDNSSGSFEYTGASITARNLGSSNHGAMGLWTFDGTTLYERMRIDKDGNVTVDPNNSFDVLFRVRGRTELDDYVSVNDTLYVSNTLSIGNASPNTPFSMKVNGASNPVGITQNEVAGASSMEFTTADGSSNQATRFVLRGSGNTPNIGMFVGAAGSEVEYIRFDGTNQRLGIGTAAPQSELHINSSSASSSTIRLTNTATASNGLWIQSNSGSASLLNYENTSLTFGTNGATRMTITNTGDIGIGTSTPSEKLDVVGNVEIPAANDYTYATAKAAYISVPSTAFILDENNTSILSTTVLNGNYRTIAGGTSTVAGYFYAPVYLPNDAVVTQVEFYVWDNDATYEVSGDLLRNTLGGTTVTTMATTTSTGTATASNAVVAVTDNTIASATIDNQLYSYYLRFNTMEANSNLRIYGARIGYSVTKVD
ncbi:MAG: phage tail protein [Flavobacteriales bacterium]